MKDTSAAPKSRHIDINLAWCKACGICSEVCPKDVFDLDADGKPIAARLADCIGCDLCEQLCPDLAVTVHECDVREGARGSLGEGT